MLRSNRWLLVWGAMLVAKDVPFADTIVELIYIYDKPFVHVQG